MTDKEYEKYEQVLDNIRNHITNVMDGCIDCADYIEGRCRGLSECNIKSINYISDIINKIKE